MQVGAVVFGPKQSPEEALRMQMDAARWQMAAMPTFPLEVAQSCGCMGPQPGETKCPCALRAELAHAERMLREGVIINGRRYRLVQEEVST